MRKYFDKLIDSITMYRLVLYYLIALLVIAVILAATGHLHYSPSSIIISSVILVVACWIANEIFATVFDAPTNFESSYITALILALIVTPATDGPSYAFLAAVSGLAMASKYMLAIGKKHIFNPAAIAIVLTALGPKQSASWWVGTQVMLPFVLIGGILVIVKVQRVRMALTFIITSFTATAVYAAIDKTPILTTLNKTALTSAVFFLAFVMLTEPATSPPTKQKQTWYAIIVGLLFPPQMHLLSFYSSPEISLIVGNIYSYIVSPKTKLFPILKEKIRIAPDSIDFVFNPCKRLAYEPGQYMEWTLDHEKADARGVRRYFTLSSSPTEDNIRIGVKFYNHGSSFKEALLDIDKTTAIVASGVSGAFVMPRDHKQKLAFIAGGIGITPFRSMVKYLVDKNETRSVTLLYSARNAQELAYKPLLEEARKKISMNCYYYLTDPGAELIGPNSRIGMISAEAIKKDIPDYLDRVFYISGTHPMVSAVESMLKDLGVANHNIKVDFFPGYA